MTLEQIKRELRKLPPEKKWEIAIELLNEAAPGRQFETTPRQTNDPERVLRIRRALRELAGSIRGVWPEDAQEYVNRLRDGDREF